MIPFEFCDDDVSDGDFDFSTGYIVMPFDGDKRVSQQQRQRSLA